MEVDLEAINEDQPGQKWVGVFDRHWHAYSRWFLRDGVRSRPTYLESVRALREHMPELMPAYEGVVEAAGGGDLEARFLSMWCPPAYVGGCSQLIVPGDQPLLIRNYDYAPKLFEGTWLCTRLGGRRTICMSDCLWGVLDGMNEDGLAVSLAFGGRTNVGRGFGIPIILRYVLEFAADVPEAIAILKRLPTHMSYSIALLDRKGRHATVFLAPDREAEETALCVTANHQHKVEWPRHAKATRSVERERVLLDAVSHGKPAAELLNLFLSSPVHQGAYGRGYGTLYTAVYNPADLSVELLWQNHNWRQTMGEFVGGTHRILVDEEPS